jgi:Ni,Fe-hydrogenase I cytochrome b subunit
MNPHLSVDHNPLNQVTRKNKFWMLLFLSPTS